MLNRADIMSPVRLAPATGGLSEPSLTERRGDQLAQPGWVQRRAVRVRCSPHDAVLRLRVVAEELLLDLISCLIQKSRGEDEHHFVLGPALPVEDVLQY